MTPYWEDANRGLTIYLGDCRDILPTFADGEFGSVVTDPPYNQGIDYGAFRDDMDDEDYRAEQLDVMVEAARATRVGGSLLYLNWPEMASWMFHALPELAPAHPFDLLAWVYHAHTSGPLLRRAYRLWAWWGVSVKPDCINTPWLRGTYRNPSDKRIARKIASGEFPMDLDWWEVEQVKNVCRDKTEHPCQLPIGMVTRLVGAVGGTVLDPYMGSGTTLVAAAKLGIPAMGIEISDRYCEMARCRLEGGFMDDEPSHLFNQECTRE